MKLLSLDPTYRIWLNSRHALSLDGDLNERFVGLTHSESIIFAEMSKPPFTSFDKWEVDTLMRFVEMHERHELYIVFGVKARISKR